MSAHHPHVIVLIGPTASGKTELAIDIAEYFKIHIHNIDSRQMIYPVSFATHFKKENKSKRFPLSENISLNSLHLPSSTQLKINEIRYISNKVLEGLQKYS